ncbi:MAG: YIP1 family protein [Candidatus Thorarchaeota archaeon]
MRRCEFCDSPVPADATFCPVCREEIAEETLERILPILRRPDAPEIRVLGTTDRLWGVIRRPAAAYRDIGKRPDYVGPLVVLVMNALIMGVFFLMLSSKFTTTVYINQTAGTTAVVSILETSRGIGFWMAGLASILTNIILGMIYLVIGAAFAHFAFKITGETYHLSIFSESQIVQLIFASPVWLTIDYMTTAAFVWVGFLLIFGIREAHDTSTLWAILVSTGCMIVLGWTFWQVH